MYFSKNDPGSHLPFAPGQTHRRLDVPSLVMTLLVLFYSAVGASLTYAEDAAPSPYLATLQKHGVQPDAAGLSEYLRQLHPSEQQRRETRRLVEQLGSKKYADRESAMAQLAQLRNPPIKALQIAAESDNAEVRLRARKILFRVETPALYAVFKTIERDKIPGLTAELLRALALCNRPHLRLAARAAVRATARPDDASLLQKKIKDDDREVVIAAIGGLGAALGKSARDDLRRLSQHETEAIRLAAARALADQGDRTSLASLVNLLDAASLDVRIGAVKTLRQLTHAQHNYVAFTAVAARKEAILRWTAWLEGKGRTAKLHFPLKEVRFEWGRTLITYHGSQGKVIELDERGKQVWQMTGLDHVSRCTGLSNGHRLISYSRSVVEYDAVGTEVWRKDGLPKKPNSVRRMDNGNTLIACGDSQKVLEIRPDGSTAWEITIHGRPMDARRLESGRTLLALFDGNRVVEVDRLGKVHWEIKGLERPATAQRLENGNTLVAEVAKRGRVAEWDRGGKIVWQRTDLRRPSCAERLSNGNTLIAQYHRDLREVDRQGKIIWQKKMSEVWQQKPSGVAHATRY